MNGNPETAEAVDDLLPDVADVTPQSDTFTDLLEFMLENRSQAQDAWKVYRAFRVSETRATLDPDQVLLALGLVRLHGYPKDYMDALVDFCLDRWDEMARTGDYRLDEIGLPKKPTNLLPVSPGKSEEEETLASPGFVSTAKILDQLGRSNSKKKTSSENPVDVLRQALGQEMASVAFQIVAIVESGASKPTTPFDFDFHREIVLYAPFAHTQAAPKSKADRDRIIQDDKDGYDAFVKDNEDKVKDVGKRHETSEEEQEIHHAVRHMYGGPGIGEDPAPWEPLGEIEKSLRADYNERYGEKGDDDE